jgi:hypothetical protein
VQSAGVEAGLLVLSMNATPVAASSSGRDHGSMVGAGGHVTVYCPRLVQSGGRGRGGEKPLQPITGWQR